MSTPVPERPADPVPPAVRAARERFAALCRRIIADHPALFPEFAEDAPAEGEKEQAA